MNEYIKYFDEINAQYDMIASQSQQEQAHSGTYHVEGHDIQHDQTASQNDEIPAAMCEFYRTFQYAELPYGRIYDVDTACRQSRRAPFFPDWFVFGQDNYFCFWLCRRGETDDGLYFTYWDHESGTGIKEPVWADLLSFLREVQEDSEDF